MIGLNEEAWSAWLAYRKAIKKPLREFSWPLAQKRMAALGDLQMEAVNNSIANGYQGLFEPRKSKQDIDAEKRKQREQIEMRELEARAVKVDFRSPIAGEDVGSYRALVERAETQVYYKRRGLQPIGSLLK
jgi:hypothetical protein